MTAADDQTAGTGDHRSAAGTGDEQNSDARITVENATGEELPAEMRMLFDALAAYPSREFPAPSDDEDETTRAQREAHEALSGLMDGLGDIEITVTRLPSIRR